MAGTKETQDIVKFVIALGNAIGKSLEDGKFSLRDIYNFLGILGMANAAVGNWKEVKNEIKDLDPAEIEELIALVRKNLKLNDAELKARIDQGFALLKQANDLYKIVKNYL